VNDLDLANLLNKFAAAYRQTLTDLELEAYVEDLGQIDRPTLLAAMRIYKANGKAFFPTIPEFLAAVRSVQRVSGGELPSPTEAWGTFLKKLYRWNPDIARGNPDAEIARVGLTPLELECARRLGGFWALRFMSDHDIHFKAKAFEGIYREVAERREVEDALMAIEPARVPLLGEG
jgi:hypothetical protein